MSECVQMEIELECGKAAELERWAGRLNTTVPEIVARAIGAWLSEMNEDGPLD